MKDKYQIKLQDIISKYRISNEDMADIFKLLDEFYYEAIDLWAEARFD